MTYIQLQTEIPGPNSRAVLERRAAATPTGLAKLTDIVVERAEGALVHDVDGNTFIDLAGGIGALATGHVPESVVASAKAQMDKLIHMCMIVGTYEPYIEFAELLNDVTPGDFPKKTTISVSGSEAIENAIKIARAYTGRQAVVAFEGAYHGRTMMAMSLTSKYGLFKKTFGPFAPEVYRAPVPYMYRKPKSLNEEEYLDLIMERFDQIMLAHVDPSAAAAVIIEPVIGEGGFLPMPKVFLEHIRQYCDDHGMVMIVDEVQCGMGRTGKLFAIEHSGVVPDIVVTAKSIGSGFPISAVTGRAEIMDAPHPGGIGGTYGGNPVACAAAIETIRLLQTDDYKHNIQAMGDTMCNRMMEWKEKYEIIGDVRGLGTMLLFEVVKDKASKIPYPEATLAITKAATQRGVIAIRAGLHSNGIRLLPPLNMSQEMLSEALDVLEESIAQVQADMG